MFKIFENEWVVGIVASLGTMLVVKHVAFLRNIFAPV
jgi:hypothetical protein